MGDVEHNTQKIHDAVVRLLGTAADKKALVQYVYRRCSRGHIQLDQQDVLQAATEKMLRLSPDITPTMVKALLYKGIREVVWDSLRKDWRRINDVDLTAAEHVIDERVPDETQLVQRIDLLRAIAKLPACDQRILWDSYWLGHTSTEICTTVTKGAHVRRRLAQIIQRLREILTE